MAQRLQVRTMGAQLVWRGQLEIGEVKSWRHCATHQAPGVTLHRLCCEPVSSGNHVLWARPGAKVKADLGAANLSAWF